MKKLYISIFVSVLVTGCATQKGLNKTYLEGVKEVAYLEVYLSPDTRNFQENLFLRGKAMCNTSLSRMLGKKTIEGEPTLIATRRYGDNEDYVKVTVPANKPLALSLIKHKVRDLYYTNFVVLLKPNKTYRVVKYKKLEVFEKSTKKPAYFLPTDYFHQLLKCEDK